MLVKLILDELLGKSVLNNLKGIYTFQTTKGKPVIYMYNSSEQFKINMRKVARFLFFFLPRQRNAGERNIDDKRYYSGRHHS